MSSRPVIGVFDSGFGGLTVLRELIHQLPGAEYLYLGDTAHLPYGSKSQEAITQYTRAAIHLLASYGAECAVIACNTASALALPVLRSESPLPLTGVIAPGAAAAAAIAPSGSIALVLATEGTVASRAYAQACASHGLRTVEKACPLFVPLVEEGWIEGPIAQQVATVYLTEALALTEERPAVVVLGCTHYPLLRPLLGASLERLAGAIPIVDSAAATAASVAALLPHAVVPGRTPKLRFLVTDSTQKFQRLGTRFLGQPIDSVELVALSTDV